MKVDKRGIHFYYHGGQTNCHFKQLNPFLYPRAWFGRVRIFINSFIDGRKREKGKK